MNIFKVFSAIPLRNPIKSRFIRSTLSASLIVAGFAGVMQLGGERFLDYAEVQAEQAVESDNLMRHFFEKNNVIIDEMAPLREGTNWDAFLARSAAEQKASDVESAMLDIIDKTLWLPLIHGHYSREFAATYPEQIALADDALFDTLGLVFIACGDRLEGVTRESTIERMSAYHQGVDVAPFVDYGYDNCEKVQPTRYAEQFQGE